MSIAAEQSMTTTATNSSKRQRVELDGDELTMLKLELLKAEVRLAKSRAGVAGAEADVKVLSAKLKAYTK